MYHIKTCLDMRVALIKQSLNRYLNIMHNYLMNNLYIKIAFKIYDSKGANQVIVGISACLLSFYY